MKMVIKTGSNIYQINEVSERDAKSDKGGRAHKVKRLPVAFAFTIKTSRGHLVFVYAPAVFPASGVPGERTMSVGVAAFAPVLLLLLPLDVLPSDTGKAFGVNGGGFGSFFLNDLLSLSKRFFTVLGPSGLMPSKLIVRVIFVDSSSSEERWRLSSASVSFPIVDSFWTGGTISDPSSAYLG